VVGLRLVCTGGDYVAGSRSSHRKNSDLIRAAKCQLTAPWCETHYDLGIPPALRRVVVQLQPKEE
jgi:hypothetical protein